jgi:hypothetical protein
LYLIFTKEIHHMPVFVQQRIFKLSNNKIFKYEGGAALGTMSPGDTAVRQAGGHHERLGGGSTNCQAPGWVVVRCFPVCATTQPFLLPCLANCCVPEQRAPHHGGVFDSLSFQSKTLKFARFGNWGGGVYGGPIFDKNFAIHAKLKLGKFLTFFKYAVDYGNSAKTPYGPTCIF